MGCDRRCQVIGRVFDPNGASKFPALNVKLEEKCMHKIDICPAESDDRTGWWSELQKRQCRLWPLEWPLARGAACTLARASPFAALQSVG